MRPIILACNVYVSEGQSRAIIDQLTSIAKSIQYDRTSPLVNIFVDAPYNRTNFTFLSRSTAAIADAAVALSREALSCIDLQHHIATHPRLGIVDHISCHPLEGSLDDAAQAATMIGQQLGTGPNPVPVYLYGHAHPQNRPLDAIRRALGYFQATTTTTDNDATQWKGGISHTEPALPPDYGPSNWSLQHGASCIGAVPWLTNYNILLNTDDMKAARLIAKKLSGRHGGIPGVQTMALQHEKGIEVACNLLSDGITLGSVRQALEVLASEHGDISIIDAYTTNKTREELIEMLQERERAVQ